MIVDLGYPRYFSYNEKVVNLQILLRACLLLNLVNFQLDIWSSIRLSVIGLRRASANSFIQSEYSYEKCMNVLKNAFREVIHRLWKIP